MVKALLLTTWATREWWTEPSSSQVHHFLPSNSSSWCVASEVSLTIPATLTIPFFLFNLLVEVKEACKPKLQSYEHLPHGYQSPETITSFPPPQRCYDILFLLILPYYLKGHSFIAFGAKWKSHAELVFEVAVNLLKLVHTRGPVKADLPSVTLVCFLIFSDLTIKQKLD